MNNVQQVLVATFLLLGLSPAAFSQSTPVYESENLVVSQLTESTFVHISYLPTRRFGKVACNGLVVIDGTEAVIVDTPTTDSTATELIDWVQGELEKNVKAVVATHFHEDCLGGLNAFHERGIASYAYDSTQVLAQRHDAPVPKHGFHDPLRLSVGDEEVICAFLGEGHTVDNSVCYVSGEQVLFGGCLVKAMGADEGNLEDANPNAWPTTIANVKHRFSNVAYVVPGHGNPGDSSLLNYTIQLFSPR